MIVLAPSRQTVTVVLATWFLVTLLLDRFSGWHVSSAHPLIAGSLLAFLTWPDRPREAGRFSLCLIVLIAWMLFRDVSTGGNWRAGERMLKACVLVVGLIACSRLDFLIWGKVLRCATGIGIASVIAYLGLEQLVTALGSPLAMAAEGFVSEMNRNALAVPLGLLACWVLLAVRPVWPVWAWGPLAVFIVVLMIANGSRNAMLSMIVATLLALFLLSPRKVAVSGGRPLQVRCCCSGCSHRSGFTATACSIHGISRGRQCCAMSAPMRGRARAVPIFSG